MLLLLLTACGPDLPEEWRGAERIEDFVQKECDGNPYDEYTSTVDAAAEGSHVDVVYGDAPFRCAQEVEGFWKQENQLLSILVQPVDMNPSEVAGCDCLYEIDMSVVSDATSVDLWRRWDNLNEPNPAERVGIVEVQ